MSSSARRIFACPVCGAPLPKGAARGAVVCAFCRTESVPEAATAPEAPETRSGVRRATTEAKASDLVCPRCDGNLYEGKTREVTLLGCGECGGIWLDNVNAQRAVRSLDAQVSELAGRAARHAQRAADRGTSARCAACRAPMRSVKATELGVDLDVCAEHGTWFDRDELAVVLEALRAARRPPPRRADVPLDPREVPDFRADQPVEWDAAALVVGGIFTVLGALVGASSK